MPIEQSGKLLKSPVTGAVIKYDGFKWQAAWMCV